MEKITKRDKQKLIRKIVTDVRELKKNHAYLMLDYSSVDGQNSPKRTVGVFKELTIGTESLVAEFEFKGKRFQIGASDILINVPIDLGVAL